MRNAHISDVHGNLEMLTRFGEAIQELNVDVVVCSGDVSGPCSEPDDRRRCQELKEDYRSAEAKLRSAFRGLTPKQKADLDITDFEGFVRVVKRDYAAQFPEVETFLNAPEELEEMARSQYGSLRDIFAGMPQRKLLVPGNWDFADYWPGYFGEWNLHRKKISVGSLRFAGYGGAEGCFNAFDLPGFRYDDDRMHDFFVREGLKAEGKRAEVFVTHVPPRKLLDEGNLSGRLLGSGMLRSAIFETRPKLVLAGHSHILGYERIEGTETYVSNPGNLGWADGSWEPHGTFNIVDLSVLLDSSSKGGITSYVLREKGAEVITPEQFAEEREELIAAGNSHGDSYCCDMGGVGFDWDKLGDLFSEG
jgi:Icc-related predicted phosphoesterase